MLRDMSQSGSRRIAADDRDSELMRLAAAPLMVRNFLYRQETEAQHPPEVRSDLPSGAALLLQQVSGWQRTAGPGVRYAQRESRLDPSLTAEVFHPSTEDREAAITNHLPQIVPNRGESYLGKLLAMFGLALVIALIFAVF